MREVHRGLFLVIGLLGAALAACSGSVTVESEPAQAQPDDVDPDPSGMPGDTDSPTPNPTEPNGGNASPDGVPDAILAACPDLAAEPTVCLTLGYPDQVLAFSPATGETCPVVTTTEPLGGPGLSSIAVLGSHVYACDWELGVARVSLDSGAVDYAPYGCDAVTGYDGKLLVLPTWSDPNNLGQMELYATFEDLIAGSPEAVLSSPDTNTRMTADGDTLYTAWHSTHEVVRWGMPGFDAQPSIQLDGFDDWINGFWVRNGKDLLVLSTGERLVTFDVDTGAEVSTLPLASQSSTHHGLRCWTAP